MEEKKKNEEIHHNDEHLEQEGDELEVEEEASEELQEEVSIESLQERIAQLESEKKALHDRYLLSEADAQNIRRRAEIDVANAHKYALEKFVKGLLPVIDAIELELKAVEEAESEHLEQFKEGSELTYKMLLDACAKFGVKQIAPLGEKLDPELHQAVTMVPHHEHESHTIIQVVQNGYLLNDRLIRAAQVIVAE